MKLATENKEDQLIINTKDSLTNNSLSNKELLRNCLENINETTKKIILVSDYLIKEYDATLLNDLKKYGTKDPVSEFMKGRTELKETRIIQEARKVMKKGMTSTDVYNKIFNPIITPRFIKSEITEVASDFKKIKTYKINESTINILSNGSRQFYELRPYESNCSYDEIKEVAQLLKEIEEIPSEVNDFKTEANKLVNGKNTSDAVKNIAIRHSIGFGVLNIILNDDKIQDIYLYSSGGNLHVTHAEYGECMTNVKLTKQDIEGIATRIRTESGRPFDDSFPVIDYDLKDYNARVCGVREPLTYKGIGYAFRKHRTIPWNLTDFIENGMITSEIAGLINFLIDGQCSILVTGPRGSGKTSFLSALISEVPNNQRIIIIEDTPELPVHELSNAGFKIQHLRVKPHLKSKATSYELSAEEALRTSLRLGESVLVIGEVRGEEAKALFEAMRVGAAGNVVLGTIHGSTVYDTFDRVVNDLGVPATSFKATDIVISCASLRKGESLSTNRRVTGITEVRKHWTSNPLIENGFNELTIFDHASKTLKISPKIKESSILKRIADLKGTTINECIESIKLRAKAKELIIKAGITKEPTIIAKCNNKITELLNGNKRNLQTELKKYLTHLKQGTEQENKETGKKENKTRKTTR